MTTDQLERDLTALAAPQADDERLRLAIREQLEPRAARRVPRTRLVVGLAAVVAAVLAAALVTLVGSGGPSADAAILAHAAHALTPPANIIVHVKETGMDDGTPIAAEWWQETNPPYALRLIKGQVGQQVEVTSDGSTSAQYDPSTNTIYEQPESKPPTLVDPIETIRAALANGTAQVGGTVTIDGRSLNKIELPTGVVGYFDKHDYQPVYLDNPQADGSIVRTQVVTYEELPLTSQNAKLLDLTAQHPGARVQAGQMPGPSKPR